MDPRSKHVDASRKGKAVEYLVAATCILASNGELNASTSLVDDEGVDIVFHRRGNVRTLAVQVKSRFREAKLLREKEMFRADVRTATFGVRDELFMLFVVVDAAHATYGPVWLIPSHDFFRLAGRIGDKLRFTASMKPLTQDKWRPFRLSRAELATALLDRLAAL